MENLYDLGVYRIINISSFLHSAYVVLKNQIEFVFYINNNID